MCVCVSRCPWLREKPRCASGRSTLRGLGLCIWSRFVCLGAGEDAWSAEVRTTKIKRKFEKSDADFRNKKENCKKSDSSFLVAGLRELNIKQHKAKREFNTKQHKAMVACARRGKFLTPATEHHSCENLTHCQQLTPKGTTALGKMSLTRSSSSDGPSRQRDHP